MHQSSNKDDSFTKDNNLGSQPILHLSEQMVINKGRERVCYIHPENNQLVIKIPRNSRGRNSGANQDELQGYRILRKEGKDLSFVSHCHGFIDTDRGQGLVCDCIRDDDGAIAKTIWDIVVLQDDCDVDYIIKVAEKLCDFLMTNQIWLFDLNLKNIVLKQLADGNYKPYIIDLKGRYANHEFIPLSRYINYFARKKLQRRSTQLLQRIVEYHHRRKELQKLPV